MEASLIVREGVHKDRVIPLPETIFLIGRDPQCHLRPHCQSVSRLHCAIAAWAGKVRVRDLKSSNGTFLNDKAIDGETAAENGDKLRVGSLVFEFLIGSSGGIAPPAPIQERDVKWLLESPDDSKVLLPSIGTCEIKFPQMDAASRTERVRPAASQSDDSPPPGSKAVSAGGHLRTYLDTRKRRS